jgi:Putative threonine efflux protein
VLPELSVALQGLLLGFQAGVSPGPLTTLLVSESLNHGRRAGWKLAIIPLCTDAPVLCIVLPLLFRLTGGRETLIGMIAALGACLLIGIAMESFKVKRTDFEKGEVPRTSFGKAYLVNITNPHLYVGWLTIYGTIAVQALQAGVLALIAFIASFYASLVGVKMLLVLLVGSARHSINATWLVYVNRFLGVALILYAFWFFRIALGFLWR